MASDLAIIRARIWPKLMKIKISAIKTPKIWRKYNLEAIPNITLCLTDSFLGNAIIVEFGTCFF